MNSLPKSNVDPPTIKNCDHRRKWRSPIPAAALYILLGLFLLGLCVFTFFLVVVHNALFLTLLLCISALIALFLLWNSRKSALLFFLHSLPDADINSAAHGQLVKITGVVSCGNVALESSYEKVSPCVYTSTMLYECRDVCWKVVDIPSLWTLAYSERNSTDFYITDHKSGIRALVKASADSKVVPLIEESRLIRTSKGGGVLSWDFKKWLAERKVSGEARSLCLREGYIKEGSSVSAVGVLQRVDGIVMIVQPNEMLSTGCLWSKMLLPMDIEGLIIGISHPNTNTVNRNCP